MFLRWSSTIEVADFLEMKNSSCYAIFYSSCQFASKEAPRPSRLRLRTKQAYFMKSVRRKKLRNLTPPYFGLCSNLAKGPAKRLAAVQLKQHIQKVHDPKISNRARSTRFPILPPLSGKHAVSFGATRWWDLFSCEQTGQIQRQCSRSFATVLRFGKAKRTPLDWRKASVSVPLFYPAMTRIIVFGMLIGCLLHWCRCVDPLLFAPGNLKTSRTRSQQGRFRPLLFRLPLHCGNGFLYLISSIDYVVCASRLWVVSDLAGRRFLCCLY